MKRAARLGDGWVAAGAEISELEGMINQITEWRKQFERDHLPFEIHTTGEAAYTPTGIEKLQKAGVDLVYIGFFNVYAGKPDGRTLDQKLAQINGYPASVAGHSQTGEIDRTDGPYYSFPTLAKLRKALDRRLIFPGFAREIPGQNYRLYA